MEAFGHTETRIEAGGYVAEVSTVGASLRSLTYRGRDLVVPFGPTEIRPMYRGAVLVPWPGRVAGGSYEFDGARYQLDLSEPARMNALHGLVCWAPFEVDGQDDTSIRLRYLMPASTGYPWMLDVEVGYSLSAEGLTWTVEATNLSDRAAPIGLGVHPYFLAGPGPVEGWTLTIPVQTRFDVDEAMIPYDLQFVDGTEYDLRRPTPVARLPLDDTFTDLDYDGNREVRAVLVDADGVGVMCRWDEQDCMWVQVFALDLDEPPPARRAVAIEPMTNPPNDFNSDRFISPVQPGWSKSMSVTISALT